MGRIGTAAFDEMRRRRGDSVIGVDFDPEVVHRQRGSGRNVILGDPTDHDFWERVETSRSKIRLVLLAMASHQANLTAVRRIRGAGFNLSIAATAQYEDEIEILQEAGADAVFNFYAEAGFGFAEHVCNRLDERNLGEPAGA